MHFNKLRIISMGKQQYCWSCIEIDCLTEQFPSLAVTFQPLYFIGPAFVRKKENSYVEHHFMTQYFPIRAASSRRVCACFISQKPIGTPGQNNTRWSRLYGRQYFVHHGRLPIISKSHAYSHTASDRNDERPFERLILEDPPE